MRCKSTFFTARNVEAESDDKRIEQTAAVEFSTWQMNANDIYVNTQLRYHDDTTDASQSLYHRLDAATREPPAHYATLADVLPDVELNSRETSCKL